MTRPPRQIKLGAFLMQTGHHIAAWRHPGAQADAAVNFRHYVDLARRAEAAKFDAIFLADAVGVRNTDLPSLSRTARSDHFELLTLLSALAAVTEKIGLIATVSTTYNEPYHVRASSPRWTRSAAAARAGTWSPPAVRARPRTSA